MLLARVSHMAFPSCFDSLDFRQDRTMSSSAMLSTSIRKLLKVALIGAPNAGKSTLLNRLLDNELSCVSNKVHTTRRNILGVYTEDDTQLEFYDSPGIVTREHLLKHRLEADLHTEPIQASARCDLIAVVVDAANIREQKRLNKGVLQILNQNEDKDSILILNKVDLVKDKRSLIDTGVRLTQGYLEKESTIPRRSLKKMTRRELEDLNLLGHLDRSQDSKTTGKPTKLHKYVIDLEADKAKPTYRPRDPYSPDEIGYRNFSQLFSISALHDDGIDDLREYMIDLAKPVVAWPHGPDFVSNLSNKDVVHEIIRGKVMDNLDHELPYVVKFRYDEFKFDDLGSLHIHLTLACPKKYMIGRIIGENGTVVCRIIDQAQAAICKTLGCDVKLMINVA